MKIQYIGTNTYQEQPLTKHFALWQPGQKSEITDQARIDLLIARDYFVSVDQEQQSFASLAEFNASGGVAAYGDGPVYIGGAPYTIKNGNLVPGGIAEKSNTLLIAGDSIVSQGNLRISGSVTVVGNVATFNMPNHQVYQGNQFWLAGENDPQWWGFYTAATVVDANNITAIVPDGFPNMPGVSYDVGIVNQNIINNKNYMARLMFSTDPNVKISNIGSSTRQVSEIKDPYLKALADLSPKYVHVGGGTNDIRNDRAVADIFADLQEMYSAASFADILFISTLPPLGPSGTGYTSERASKVLQLNRLIRQEAEDKGYFLIDIYQDWCDKSANDYATNMSSDDVHPTVHAADITVANYASKVAVKIPTAPFKSTSNADSIAVDASSRQLVTNPTLSGTGGTAGTSVTGSVANNVTVFRGGSASIVASKETRADGLGSNQVFVITSTANNDAGYFRVDTFHASVSPGDIIRGFVQVSGSSLSNVKGIEVYIDSILDGSGKKLAVATTTSGSEIVALDDDFTVHFATPELVVPSGVTITLLALRVSCLFRAAGSATIKVGCPVVIKK